MRGTAFGLLAMVLLVASPPPAKACTCELPSGPVERQVANAKREAAAVFAGRVLDVRPLEDEIGVDVRFAVSRVWKGEVGEPTVVRTGKGGGDCGYRFAPGTEYLDYCHGSDGRLSTGICTRTRPVGEADDDFRYLGRPV